MSSRLLIVVAVFTALLGLTSRLVQQWRGIAPFAA